MSGRVRRSSVLPSTQVKQRRHYVSIYSEYPDYHIALNDFEELGKKRFLLLKWIENQIVEKRPLDPLHAARYRMKEEKETIFTKLKSLNLNAKADDEISHAILRLACSSSEDRSKWFTRYETILFERRYQLCMEEEKSLIRAQLDISDEQISKKKFLQNYPELNGRSPLLRVIEGTDGGKETFTFPYHRVKFSEVPTLVSKRRVFLHRGYAFVPDEQFSEVVRNRFRARLNRSLASMKKIHALSQMREDQNASRLVPILESIVKEVDKSYKNTKLIDGEIRANQIAKLQKHMPLCMELIVTEDLKKKRYARHWGILHLSLFLKGIGLPLQEAQVYWGKMLDGEKKIKEVQGGLRHNYGATGAKKDYSPFGCYKLVDTVKDAPPEKNCHYGCPFAYYNNIKFIGHLQSKGISDGDIKDILKLKQGRHFTLACKKVFEASHRDLLLKSNQDMDDLQSSWDHPNRYFDTSYHLHNPKKIEALPTPDTPSTIQNVEPMNQKKNSRKRTFGSMTRKPNRTPTNVSAKRWSQTPTPRSPKRRAFGSGIKPKFATASPKLARKFATPKFKSLVKPKFGSARKFGSAKKIATPVNKDVKKNNNELDNLVTPVNDKIKKIDLESSSKKTETSQIKNENKAQLSLSKENEEGEKNSSKNVINKNLSKMEIDKPDKTTELAEEKNSESQIEAMEVESKADAKVEIEV